MKLNWFIITFYGSTKMNKKADISLTKYFGVVAGYSGDNRGVTAMKRIINTLLPTVNTDNHSS